MNDKAFENLVDIIQDASRSEEERTSAIHELARFPADKAIPVLIDLMDDDALSVRWTAATVIRKFGKAMLIPLLRVIATRPADDFFYESAHHALVRFGDPDVEKILDPVVKALKQHAASSTAAIEAMKALQALPAA